MDYELTEERQRYLDARGRIVLSACPGSGKTTSVVKKLKYLAEECQQKYGHYRGIACLSFTNKACDEIKSKYQLMHNENFAFPNIVSTIDSFIFEYIVSPFWKCSNLVHYKPFVTNDGEFIHSLYFATNSEGERFPLVGRQQIHIMPPEKTSLGINARYFGNKKVEKEDEKEYIESIVKYRMRKGVINSNDALYLANLIMHNNPEIAKVIISRFPYVIIDEAQDTSLMQNNLFSILVEAGLSNIEYIGDSYQAIYEWRDANPQFFSDLLADDSFQKLVLSENRRSVQRIIDMYSKIRTDSDAPIISHNVIDRNIPIKVYFYNNENLSLVINDYLEICKSNSLSNCHILVRGNSFIGNYLNTRQQVAYWKSDIPYMLIDVLDNYKRCNYSEAVYILKKIFVKLVFPTDFTKQKEYLSENNCNENSKLMAILPLIPTLEETFENWTSKSQIVLKNCMGLEQEPDFSPKKRIDGFRIAELKRQSLSQYYSNNTNSQIPIETIHSSKGASYGGVLLVLSKNSAGNNISLSEFKRNGNEISEKQRLVYVACSRAEQFLALAIPDSVSESQVIETLGVNADNISRVGIQMRLNLT
ncbi:MAG: ATP-dependent helicase [Bacteroidales bacterium]|nr:ATP-dependent helicase [Bacteroidales bacterium]